MNLRNFLLTKHISRFLQLVLWNENSNIVCLGKLEIIFQCYVWWLFLIVNIWGIDLNFRVGLHVKNVNSEGMNEWNLKYWHVFDDHCFVFKISKTNDNYRNWNNYVSLQNILTRTMNQLKQTIRNGTLWYVRNVCKSVTKFMTSVSNIVFLRIDVGLHVHELDKIVDLII